MAENIFMSPHPASAQLGLNIIDVIPDSQDFVENMSEYGVGGGTPSEANCSAISSSVLSQNDPDIEMKKKAYVQIIEQPQPKALRFRYICEGRSAGSIPGVRSTPENKTYPTIKIMNYKGPAVVVVSCVTVDPPYRPHPHNLVGKEGCSKGVCTITIDNDSMECMFSNLGIQCVKKKDVEQALKLREEIRVDPFNTGFSHRNQPQSIDLNAVRLCFQVFLNSGTEGRFTFPLKAVVSDPIYDKKATSDLNICKLSEYTSCVSGGKEIILLCDKVTKEDIQIRFTEVKDGHIEWEAYGDFQASDVHKQVAISFKTPKYKDIQVDHSVKVFIQLQRPSDKSTSEPRPFEYLPMDTDRLYNVSKRPRLFDGSESSNMDYINHYFRDVRSRQVLGGVSSMEGQSGSAPRSVKIAARASRLSDNVKIEPPESISLSPSPEPSARTVTVKPPISPHHNGGGLMYQNITPLPPPHPLQPHLQSPLFYGTPSTQAGHRPLIDVSLHSPQAHYYQVSANISIDSPYSPENSHGATAATFTPNAMNLLPNTTTNSNIDAMEASNINTYPTFTESKPPVETSGTLPDLGIINSSELMVDSVNNLSASLSCSLNLVDVPLPLNPLDKKGSEEDKRSLNTPTSDNFFANIPTSSSSDECMPSASSDSVKILKGQLETLNKLSERS